MTPLTLLTGFVPAVLGISIVFAAVGSLVLIWLYRRAVVRGMHVVSGAAALPPTRVGNAPEAALRLVKLEAGEPALSVGRRHDLEILFGGLCYAIVMSLPWQVGAGGFVPVRAAWLVACFVWPAVVIGLLVGVPARGRALRWLGGYALLLVAVAVIALARNASLSLSQLGYFFVFVNAAPTLALLAFAHRRVRAVGPLVLGFSLAGVLGAVGLTLLAGGSDDVLHALSTVGAALGLSAAAVFALLHVAGFVVLGALGAFALRLLGRAYGTKRFSDRTLLAWSSMLVFAACQSVTLAFEGLPWVASGAVAFVVFVRAADWLPKRRPAPQPPCSLLVLRVFALGRRSELLFDALSKRWRYRGPIGLIAGSDLAHATVEPHEFLDYTAGLLPRRFLAGDDGPAQALAAYDDAPDPDGRFRVNEYFCRADTWQPTMRALAARSDAVLMDLRGFTRDNAGCEYEIDELVARVPLPRILLVTDATTSMADLDLALQRAWAAAPTDSPNRSDEGPEVRLFRADGRPASTAAALVVRLADVTTAGCLAKT